jgi:hypothetical protein
MPKRTFLFENTHVYFFVSNTMLAGQFASVNIMYTYCRLKTGLAVVPQVKKAYVDAEVIYHTMVQHCRDIGIGLRAPAPVHSGPQVGIEHTAGSGRMRT